MSLPIIDNLIAGFLSIVRGFLLVEVNHLVIVKVFIEFCCVFDLPSKRPRASLKQF